jgi:hypothetical protein
MTESFETTYQKALKGLEERGIEVIIVNDEAQKFYGDLDGAAVYVGKSLDWEFKLYTMVHLAAHNYQWAVSGRYAEIGSQLFYKPDEELIKELMAYEEGAACLSISLLHELGIHHLDIEITRYSRCDMAYLDHYYHTGEEKELKYFWKDDVKPFATIPLPIISGFRRRIKVQKGVVAY